MYADRLVEVNASGEVIWDWRAYEHLEAYDHAMSDYNSAIRLAPNYADAYFNRGNLFVRVGEFYQAIANYDAAIHLNPEDAAAYRNRNLARADKERFDRDGVGY